MVEALDEPIVMGWLVSGSIRIGAVKEGADWTYHTLEVTIDSTSEIIDLLPGETCRVIPVMPAAESTGALC